MALNLDLDVNDSIVVPPNSGAVIRFVEKSGRKTRVLVESAQEVKVVRAKSAPSKPAIAQRPVVP